jgi:hypothetical protein
MNEHRDITGSAESIFRNVKGIHIRFVGIITPLIVASPIQIATKI